MQQSGIAFSSAVLFRDHILHSYYLSAEPDAVIAIILGLSAVLDTSLGEDTKYLRLSWLPLYYVSSVYILSTALEDPSRLHLASSFSCAFAAVVAMAHLVVDIDIPQKLEPPAEYTCNLLTYCMFSFVTKPILLLALWNGFLTIEDVPGLMDEDSCAEVYGALAEAVPATSLLRRLLRPISADVVKSGVFQFMSSVLNFASPLALGRIVSHVSSLSGSSGDADSFGGVSMSIHAAVGVLLLAPVLQAVVFGQMLATGRHVGIRIRAAVISLVFNKALCVDLTATGDGIGKLNNMISVDAQSIQTFMCYCHQIWSAFLEIVIAVTLLYMVLGKAAFAGVVGMLISVPSCFFLTKRMSRFQDELLERKDARMSSIGEILSSIRIIKLFAWEGRFEDQARGLRARELSSLRGYMFSRAGMSVLWEAIPTVVALITFLFRSYYLNEPLSAAQGYASLMMFSLLKHPLAAFPEMSGWCINALVALRRIAGFLAVDDILGSRRTIAAGSSGVAAETGTVVLNHACFWWNEVHNGPNDGPEKGVPAETRASLVDRVRRRLLDGALFRSDTRHVYTELEVCYLLLLAFPSIISTCDI